VVDLVEKPPLDQAPSDLAIVGRYVLLPEVLEAIADTEPGAGREIQLTDAIRRTLDGGRVVAWEFEGDYYDTGTVPGYLRANLALALKREDLRESMLAVFRELVDASEVVL
jgi:UTP--glucose-1-phosphate uridylyltransferase